MADGQSDTSELRDGLVPRRPGKWRPVVLMLGCGLSAALYLSWLFDPFRSFWLAIDEKVFWTLNDTLACCSLWQGFWAVANSSVGDVVEALTMIGVYLHFMLGKGRPVRRTLIAVGMMVTELLVIGFRIGKAIPIVRESGTLVHDAALRLSELVHWISTKDVSDDTFPGDHATVLILYAGVLTFYLPRAYAVVLWVLTGAFILPRLVAGVHWLSDDLVGSVAIAGVLISCTFATPLHRVIMDCHERLIGWVRRKWAGGAGSA